MLNVIPNVSEGKILNATLLFMFFDLPIHILTITQFNTLNLIKMKTIKHINILLFTLLLITSCNNEKTIQQLYVDSENNDDYLMLDIPTSIVELPETASAKARQAYESVDKINLLAFKINEDNKENFNIEKTKIKAILKNHKYIELMRVNTKGYKVMAKYIGSETTMNEAILFVSDNKKGFALARILGDDMKPENMVILLNEIKNIDKNNPIFKQLKGFFKP